MEYFRRDLIRASFGCEKGQAKLVEAASSLRASAYLNRKARLAIPNLAG